MLSRRFAALPFLAFATLLCVPGSATAQFEFQPGGFDFADPEGFDPLAASQEIGKMVTLSARYAPATAEMPAMVEVTADIADGHHIYSITQQAGGPQRTELRLDEGSGVRLAGPWIATPPPKTHIDEEIWIGLSIEEHYGTVTWRAPVEIAAGIDPTAVSVTGSADLQACTDTTCHALDGTAFTAELADPGSIPPPPTLPGDTPAVPSGPLEANEPSGDVEAASFGSLLPILGAAFLGGLILNLMPCVLPVIGLKVLSFAEQAGHDRGRVLAMNLAYSAGLMAVFMLLAVLAAFAGYGWGELNTHASYRIGMVIFVFAMALSFLGVWEIPLPGFAGGKGANDLQQKEGCSGAFFKGAFTTILATPCSGPFLGPVFGFLITQPPVTTFLIFATIGLGMASPYLLIGAFPSLIKVLPKPGAWMETFKQLMGFVLMGTAVYFLFWVVSPGNQKAVAVTLLGVSLACWWIGRTPLTASSAKRSTAWIGGGALAAAVGCIAFGYLATAQTVANSHGGSEHELAWTPFSQSTLTNAKAEGKTVLVDFTANWCPTCQVNSKFAINTEQVKRVVDANGVVPLLADWSNPNEEIKQTLESLGSRSIPFLAIFPASQPNSPILLPDLITEAQLLEALADAGAVEANEANVSMPTIEIGEAAASAYR